MKDIYHYQFLNENLSSSGMPTIEQMKEIADAHVDVIINLAPHEVPNAVPNEGDLANSLGMEYIHIPVTWRAPEQNAFIRFMDTMQAHASKKIHVHCEANYRASAFIMMHRVLRLGWKKEDAVPIMEKMWNPEDFPVWEAFINEQLADHQ
jgi:protein tyrosine phosphatase (PTP) superfamily phosphohydrolase (DUF442 family)